MGRVPAAGRGQWPGGARLQVVPHDPAEPGPGLPRTHLDVPDYTADGDWRRQTDAAREETRRDFSHLYLLADSLAVGRTAAGGFDGIAIYDNFVTRRMDADRADARGVGLLFSFNVNPGFDAIRIDATAAARGDLLRLPRVRPAAPPRLARPRAASGAGPGARPDHRVLRGHATLQQRPARPTPAAASSSPTSTRSTNGTRARVRADEGHGRAHTRRAPLGYHNPPDGHARLRRLRSLIDGLGMCPASARGVRHGPAPAARTRRPRRGNARG